MRWLSTFAGYAIGKSPALFKHRHHAAAVLPCVAVPPGDLRWGEPCPLGLLAGGTRARLRRLRTPPGLCATPDPRRGAASPATGRLALPLCRSRDEGSSALLLHVDGTIYRHPTAERARPAGLGHARAYAVPRIGDGCMQLATCMYMYMYTCTSPSCVRPWCFSSSSMGEHRLRATQGSCCRSYCRSVDPDPEHSSFLVGWCECPMRGRYGGAGCWIIRAAAVEAPWPVAMYI